MSEEAHAAIFRGGRHHSTWSHELLGVSLSEIVLFLFSYSLTLIEHCAKGAAAFEAMHLWEKQHPGDDHQFSKEALAALAGAEVDKLFETHGLDFLDREKAKFHAMQEARALAESKGAID
ncbi:unnamed protein product [Adineta ricciae]|uniref:Uncharacterized protein n=1 Tax=Adineta ricciae TaxID=249248 RepID=A0A815YJ54_ADIRI|nr:unnamed protein product [Adineta ricciae]